ncbi:MAG: GntR family transcriptional regulator [Anaerolineaceae bacterium]|nr:GntR family transcriptional regulator [Anaerolineaceae bacterium]
MLDFERIISDLQAPAAAPLHARVRGAIQAQIMDGTLKPGETLPPERTLQEKLGISRATVRQAIKSLINDDLLKSVVGSGTFVLEPQEAPPHNTLVGVIVPDSNYYIYYPELASSLSYYLREAGYRVDASIHNERYGTLAEITAGLLAQDVAAVVLVAPNQQDGSDVLRQLRAKGVIIVLLTRYLDNFADVDYIGADNRLVGIEATRHLIGLGHSSIVHIAASSTSTAFDRAAGYVQAMTDAGLTPQIFMAPDEPAPLPPDLIKFVMKVESSQFWNQVARKEITGVFCFNDHIASWVQKEVRKLNLVTPQDFSLVSVDNMPYAGFFDTPLTTFALPGEEIGNQAAALLLRRLKGDTFPPQRVLLPARFVQRLSTAAPP